MTTNAPTTERRTPQRTAWRQALHGFVGSAAAIAVALGLINLITG